MALAPTPATADCSADQELLGLLRWVDHLVVSGTRPGPSDVETLGVRYRGLMASRNLARLGEAGHLREGAAMPQLLALTENILAKGQVRDIDALNGALNAVYLQLSDECEEKLGSTLKDWVTDSRELIEDDENVPGDGTSRVSQNQSIAKIAGLTLALLVLIGAIFSFRTLWFWLSGLVPGRGACRIGCDLIIGDYRFQGVISILTSGACRFEFPTSTLNEFRTALSRTTNCTVAIGNVEIPGAVQTLRPSSIRIDFHKALGRRRRASILARSAGPVLQARNTPREGGVREPAPVRSTKSPSAAARQEGDGRQGNAEPSPTAAQ